MNFRLARFQRSKWRALEVSKIALNISRKVEPQNPFSVTLVIRPGPRLTQTEKLERVEDIA